MPEHLIDRKPLTRGEELRVALEPYRGRHYLHARKWYPDPTSGELRPGKGLAIDVRDAPWLLHALQTAVTAAAAAGLVAEEDFELAGLPVPAELLS